MHPYAIAQIIKKNVQNHHCICVTKSYFDNPVGVRPKDSGRRFCTTTGRQSPPAHRKGHGAGESGPGFLRPTVIVRPEVVCVRVVCVPAAATDHYRQPFCTPVPGRADRQRPQRSQ